jgi:hypothetical protein
MFEKKQFFLLVILITLFAGIYIFTRANSTGTPGVTDVSNSMSEADAQGLMSLMDIYPIHKPELRLDFRLKSLDNDWVELKNYQGQVVLLSFWATW